MRIAPLALGVVGFQIMGIAIWAHSLVVVKRQMGTQAVTRQEQQYNSALDIVW